MVNLKLVTFALALCVTLVCVTAWAGERERDEVQYRYGQHRGAKKVMAEEQQQQQQQQDDFATTITSPELQTQHKGKEAIHEKGKETLPLHEKGGRFHKGKWTEAPVKAKAHLQGNEQEGIDFADMYEGMADNDLMAAHVYDDAEAGADKDDDADFEKIIDNANDEEGDEDDEEGAAAAAASSSSSAAASSAWRGFGGGFGRGFGHGFGHWGGGFGRGFGHWGGGFGRGFGWGGGFGRGFGWGGGWGRPWGWGGGWGRPWGWGGGFGFGYPYGYGYPYGFPPYPYPYGYPYGYGDFGGYGFM